MKEIIKVLREAEVLHQLGFNVVGNQMPEVREKFKFVSPGHTHSVKFGPAATQTEVDAAMKSHAERFAKQTSPSSLPIPFGFADEVCCRPTIGENATARAHFHAWLAEQKIAPRDLGVARLTDVVPIDAGRFETARKAKRPRRATRVLLHLSVPTFACASGFSQITVCYPTSSLIGLPSARICSGRFAWS